jgi:hypothetical protein
MITDPRTTVSSRRGRLLVAFMIALVEAGIRLGGDMQVAALAPLYRSPPIYALFLVGPVAMWIDLRRRAKAEKVSAGQPARSSDTVAGRRHTLPAVNGLAEN